MSMGIEELFFRAEREPAPRSNVAEWIEANPVTDCLACGYPAYCDCPTCFRDIPAGMFPSYDIGGDTWACGNCGHTESMYDREDRAMEYYDRAMGYCSSPKESQP